MERITGDEPISGWASTHDEAGMSYGNGNDGLTIRQYFANLNVTWVDAVSEYIHVYRKNGTIKEVADLLAEMKLTAADSLIAALNKQP